MMLSKDKSIGKLPTNTAISKGTISSVIPTAAFCTCKQHMTGTTDGQ